MKKTAFVVLPLLLITGIVFAKPKSEYSATNDETNVFLYEHFESHSFGSRLSPSAEIIGRYYAGYWFKGKNPVPPEGSNFGVTREVQEKNGYREDFHSAHWKNASKLEITLGEKHYTLTGDYDTKVSPMGNGGSVSQESMIAEVEPEMLHTLASSKGFVAAVEDANGNILQEYEIKDKDLKALRQLVKQMDQK